MPPKKTPTKTATLLADLHAETARVAKSLGVPPSQIEAVSDCVVALAPLIRKAVAEEIAARLERLAAEHIKSDFQPLQVIYDERIKMLHGAANLARTVGSPL